MTIEQILFAILIIFFGIFVSYYFYNKNKIDRLRAENKEKIENLKALALKLAEN